MQVQAQSWSYHWCSLILCSLHKACLPMPTSTPTMLLLLKVIRVCVCMYIYTVCVCVYAYMCFSLTLTPSTFDPSPTLTQIGDSTTAQAPTASPPPAAAAYTFSVGNVASGTFSAVTPGVPETANVGMQNAGSFYIRVFFVFLATVGTSLTLFSHS